MCAPLGHNVKKKKKKKKTETIYVVMDKLSSE